MPTRIDRSASTPGRVRKQIQRLGPWTRVYPAGTTSPIDCQHDKHTRMVAVVCYVESGSTHDELAPRVQHLTNDVVRLIFGAPLASETRVVIGRIV